MVVIVVSAYLEPVVAAVVDDEHERADAYEIDNVGEGEQENGGNVMNEHFPEVLAFHIDELGEDQRPVEGQL